ncbi:uncharacterized protein Z518_02192 [Rhinocladiella mackenziei CBS 650.93]|uniref:Glutamine amidotransferase domain-containing protein n=1 Tax=Rhinocladiella mackenziei CBS 650.93 TaxID=1442369 RepID=A0A0D2IP08_9EURO|nr:uncharacterized protein Z518_02192 [Rhinocladiella mackenziei CBS 650.93]KIX07539.1 hypothetical protein Z518_02192 [Rhinocladiella mackenziei CBS 650.93]
MHLPSHTINIAVLICENLVDDISDIRGPFDKIFQDFFERGAQSIRRHPEYAASRGIVIRTTPYDCTVGEFPARLDEVDALVVTGSTAGAYEDIPWVKKLSKNLQDAFQNHPSVKIFGTCFGHQIINQSLFFTHGIRVEKNPTGWELGVQQIDISPKFAACFPRQFTSPTNSPKMDLQLSHQDHVVVVSKSELPRECVEVGTSILCKTQGMYWPGRVLTYQGHPEFDRFINGACIKWIGATEWSKEVTEGYLKLANKDDDSNLAAEIVIEFFLQNSNYQTK